MVGKAAVIWLLLFAVLGVAVVDAVSIGRTTLHLSEVATAGRERWRRGVPFTRASVIKACETAAATIEAQDPA